MRVLRPLTFRNADLISSTAVETVALYVAGTTYAIDVFVRYGERIYQSLVAGNIGNQPDISPAKWQDFGPSNKTAMFDTQLSTSTTGASPLVVVLQPLQFFNSLAFIGTIGTSINVTIKDGAAGPVIYNQTKVLDGTVITDWYMYFYEPFDTLDILTFLDIPVYLNSYITVTITGTGTVSCGTMLYGTVYTLGGTQYGATSGIRDFSVKETDDFGNTKFVRRAYSNRMEAQIFMDNSTIRANKKLLTDLRAIPALWIGVDDPTYEPLSVFGFYRDFNIEIPYPTFSMCSLEIEGLI